MALGKYFMINALKVYIDPFEFSPGVEYKSEDFTPGMLQMLSIVHKSNSEGSMEPAVDFYENSKAAPAPIQKQTKGSD